MFVTPNWFTSLCCVGPPGQAVLLEEGSWCAHQHLKLDSSTVRKRAFGWSLALCRPVEFQEVILLEFRVSQARRLLSLLKKALYPFWKLVMVLLLFPTISILCLLTQAHKPQNKEKSANKFGGCLMCGSSPEKKERSRVFIHQLCQTGLPFGSTGRASGTSRKNDFYGLGLTR